MNWLVMSGMRQGMARAPARSAAESSIGSHRASSARISFPVQSRIGFPVAAPGRSPESP